MPDHLRGARTRIRHNSTEEERRKGRLRTTHLRVFPESDPQFRGLHGIRQDTESNHANLKSLLDDDRARSNGLTNQRLDMMAWAIYSNLRAALSHTHRTGLPPPVIRAHDPPHAAAA